ncbi:MAG: multiheme c-type cytochrome [Planctomycetota bacterium]|nr:multiheme c-type cytochrome [Planctomycetota bacterium]
MIEVPRTSSPRAVTPRLRRILRWVLLGFGLMVIDSLYLLGVRFLDWLESGGSDTLLSIWAFLLHVILGLILVIPVIVYGIGHMRRARRSPNRNARRVGYVLFLAALVLLVSGVLLLRIDGLPALFASAEQHDIVWWIHVLVPLVVIWLFIAHRMVGPRLDWARGARWAGGTIVSLVALFVIHESAQIRGSGTVIPFDGPLTNAALLGHDSIPVSALTSIEGCVECHPDAHSSWSSSAHRFSSFDNPVYAATVRETRKVDPQLSTFCASCHDPVLLASGSLDDVRLDDPSVDPHSIPGATAGVNCLVCHSITQAGPAGNGSWVMQEPVRYPFHDSSWSPLQWLNRQLIRSRPALHRTAMTHEGVTDSAVMCGSCHKAWIPESLNQYRWLAGQNHYDSWRSSGVSGHGLDSWRWPESPETDCNGCHMPLRPSTGVAARDRDGSGVPTVHDHLFAAGNTGLMHLLDLPDCSSLLAEYEQVLQSSMRVDIVGLREGGVIDGAFIGPIRPDLPRLSPGSPYLLEVVSRNTGTGHAFTQGTSDSNEIWLEIEVFDGERLIAASGLIDASGVVDPWAYRLNSFTIDSEGYRVENRMPETIFTKVYDHQVAPGSARTTHYLLEVPDGIEGPLRVDARLRYRKFDHALMEFVYGPSEASARVNSLPAVVVASDSVALPIQGGATSLDRQTSEFPTWERLYDYGIGLAAEGKKGPLRQSAEAFEMVEALGRLEGAFGLAKVNRMQGRLDQAVEALDRAAGSGSTVAPWGVTYLSGLLDLDRGLLDESRERFASLAFSQAESFPSATERGFDFHGSDALLLHLASVELRSSGSEDTQSAQRVLELVDAVLKRDPQSARAFWLRAQALDSLGRTEEAAQARRAHERYRGDEQAAEEAVRKARTRYPWADHAAEPIAIYRLEPQDRAAPGS